MVLSAQMSIFNSFKMNAKRKKTSDITNIDWLLAFSKKIDSTSKNKIIKLIDIPKKGRKYPAERISIKKANTVLNISNLNIFSFPQFSISFTIFSIIFFNISNSN